MLKADLPIKTASEDTLNRNSFSQSLAQVMLEYSSSEAFAIGLYGKWGSGKTSVINMILEHVQNMSDNTVILRFNPWLCSDPKQLISQFFKQLSSTLKMKKSTLLNICDLMDAYANAFDLVGVIPVAGKLLSIFLKVLGVKAKAYKEKKGDLQNVKNQIVDALAASKIKIVITIDDIDRLSENEIISVFQLVKSLADFPYTIYLLAFDYDVVIKALEKVQNGNGAEYLEKVIQVPFELPAPNENDIFNILFEKLDSLIINQTEKKWDKDTWSELFTSGLKGYIKTIRDVIRYTNVFSLKYTLTKDETDTVDLLGITCLQVFEPTVYSKLPLFKERLCGGVSYYSSQSQHDEALLKNARSVLISEVVEANKETVEHILCCLFPKLCSLTDHGYRYGKSYQHNEFLLRGNIACPTCFDRYFSLTLEPKAIPSSFIDNMLFIADDSSFLSSLELIRNEKKTDQLFTSIEAYCTSQWKKDINEQRALLILKCIVQYGIDPTEDDNHDQEFFYIGIRQKLSYCIMALIDLIMPQNRYGILESLFNDMKVSLSTLYLVLRDFEIQHSRFVDEEKQHEKQSITIDEVYRLERIFTNRVSSELDSATLLSNDDTLGILWLFEKIVPDLAKDKIQKIVTDDISIADLIHNCVSYSMVASRTVNKLWNVNIDAISKYINIDEAYKRILTFTKTSAFAQMPMTVQEDIAAFLIKMESNKSQDNSMHDEIALSAIKERLGRIYNEC